MTTRCFLQVTEVYTQDVFVRQLRHMWAAWNVCVQDTPIFCRAHAYNEVGLFIKEKWWE